MERFYRKLPHCLTQHNRFAFWAHANFCFAKTSFMLKTLGEISDIKINENCEKNEM